MQLTYHQQKKKKNGTCVSNRCIRPLQARGNYCRYCYKKQWIKKNPEKHCYNTLLMNAKRRGKFIDLTFDEFKYFLSKNPSYMNKKGTKVKSLQIDRKDNELGYTLSNIRCITLKENRWKQHAVDYQTSDPSKENYCGF